MCVLGQQHRAEALAEAHRDVDRLRRQSRQHLQIMMSWLVMPKLLLIYFINLWLQWFKCIFSTYDALVYDAQKNREMLSKAS